MNDPGLSVAGRCIAVIWALFVGSTVAFGQGQITTVSPDSAAQGTSGLTVTFTLANGTPTPPPADAPVDSATIGAINGTSLVRVDQYTVTAVFDILFSEAVGTKDAVVTFQPPVEDPLTYTKSGSFTVTAGADTPPTITSHPSSCTVTPGASVTFTMVASGTAPLSYQWQKETADLGTETNAAYSIASAAESDEGDYRCIVANAFGAATSSVAVLTVDTNAQPVVAYVVQDTGQTDAYDEYGNVITPSPGDAYYGQDAHYDGMQQAFQDNGDGTVTDFNTGLMWQQTPPSDGYGWKDASTYCETLELAGYDDWRLPTLKELFAIGNYSEGWPYLDETYFDIAGDTVSKDEQFWGIENYVGVSVESGSDGAFGVNHGTGHIKVYPSGVGPGGGKRVRAVRGEITAINDFTDNGDSTITDNATGLMWSQADNGAGITWSNALDYAENAELAGYTDWRLPNVKELQSIVDYSYSPTATDSNAVGPAIDPIFSCSSITNEAGRADYPYFWSSTSARFEAGGTFYYAWYVAFGMAVNGEGEDFHGAGAVRFDTKALDGPAGEDAERYYNYVRCVRTVDTLTSSATPTGDYDGDGKSDLAVFDENSGYWYAYNLQLGQATVWAQSWGEPGFEPVPGDYDGDGISDLCAYDQNTGCWYAWSVAKSQVLVWAQPWGWTGAETVLGDYDGDGISDLGIYDQASGYWFIITPAGVLLTWAQPWGGPGFEPVPGDYDGDGRNDLCVYDNNTGYWYAWSLADSQLIAWEQQWGWPGAITVPGDYDGDGKSDLCVYDNNTGYWYAWSLADSQLIAWEQHWGWPGAVPVPGDYDGDGKADLALFDAIQGYWYIWSLAKGELITWQQPWGWPGATPPGGRY